ncbi:uncharacterized protein G2W53_008689 [Senna tora]|uniref:Uncharacterized protein n=1 Tax=Senna tora TaxID=362788 RepID=A0A834X991_9FABA|nr:uncharacterized protein G2W53_008689 [Senna tora]
MERMQRFRLNSKAEIYNNGLRELELYLKSDQVQRNRTNLRWLSLVTSDLSKQRKADRTQSTHADK